MNRNASKKQRPKFNRNAYEASLSAKELERFHRLVRSDKTIEQIRSASIPWRKGKSKGKKIWAYTIHRIRSRLDLEEMLREIEGTSRFMEIVRKPLDALVEGTEAEKVIDHIMALIGEEVIHRTLKRLNPAARDSAARLLLKRGDQRRVDRRLAIVEKHFNKNAPPNKSNDGLTEEEQEQRMKEIFGV